jgi:hypothetical protein
VQFGILTREYELYTVVYLVCRVGKLLLDVLPDCG